MVGSFWATAERYRKVMLMRVQKKPGKGWKSMKRKQKDCGANSGTPELLLWNELRKMQVEYALMNYGILSATVPGTAYFFSVRVRVHS